MPCFFLNPPPPPLKKALLFKYILVVKTCTIAQETALCSSIFLLTEYEC